MFTVKHYYSLKYLKGFEAGVLKSIFSMMCIFFMTRISMTSSVKKVELELLTDIDLLLIIERGIRQKICDTNKRANKSHERL